jgi:hypothetical protein
VRLHAKLSLKALDPKRTNGEATKPLYRTHGPSVDGSELAMRSERRDAADWACAIQAN